MGRGNECCAIAVDCLKIPEKEMISQWVYIVFLFWNFFFGKLFLKKEIFVATMVALEMHFYIVFLLWNFLFRKLFPKKEIFLWPGGRSGDAFLHNCYVIFT